MPFEYPDPNALTDRSIEDSVLPAEERDQYGFLSADNEYNPALFDQMNADQQRETLLREVQNTYNQEFEGPRAYTPEAITPETDIAGIVSMTESLTGRRKLELGIANNAPVMPYVPTAVNKPDASVNTYRYQQPGENVVTRSYEDPKTDYGLAA